MKRDFPPIVRLFPSRENSTLLIGSSKDIFPIDFFILISHKRTVLSSEPVAKKLISECHFIVLTSDIWPLKNLSGKGRSICQYSPNPRDPTDAKFSRFLFKSKSQIECLGV